MPAPTHTLASLPAGAFARLDPTPDSQFYLHPRFVTHIDDTAIAAVTALYRRILPANGDILDLMSSWVSHLPSEITFNSVTGHGMNAAELAANLRLTARHVQDLNATPQLPYADARFDAATLCVSVQYLQHPMEVFAEIRRVLRPASPFIVTFSNRCFPTKAVAIWRALAATDQQRLVTAYMTEAGFHDTTTEAFTPRGADPLYAVIAHTSPASTWPAPNPAAPTPPS